MKLYSGPLSLFTAKTRIALDEKRLPYDRVEVGWSLEHRYEPHHPDVVALNPKRQVPVLVDGDVVVYDSTVIAEYLEDAHPEPPLFPRSAAGRARCRQLEAAADEILFAHVWDLIEESFYPGDRDGARLDAAKAGVAAYADGLEKEFAGREWLCEVFSVADIGNFVFSNAAATLGAPVTEGRTALAAWNERVSARPAVRQEIDAMNAFVAKIFAASNG